MYLFICSEGMLTHLFFPGCVNLVGGLAHLGCSSSDLPHLEYSKNILGYSKNILVRGHPQSLRGLSFLTHIGIFQEYIRIFQEYILRFQKENIILRLETKEASICKTPPNQNKKSKTKCPDSLQR